MLSKFFDKLSGIRSIFKKELIQLMRDPYLVAFIITLPVIQLMVTGLAVQKDLKHIATVVCNYDKRNASFELIQAFKNSTYFNIDDKKDIVSSESELNQAIRHGKYRVGLIIPPDYSERVLAGNDQANINIVLDGTNANISKIILDAANAIVLRYASDRASEQMLGGASDAFRPVILQSKVLYNPSMKTSYFLIPAILAIIMHMLTILFTSFAIVRERETGTLEQLMVTPIKVSDLMMGKVLPYALIGFLDMLLTLVVMIWFFQISITGSFWFLCVASIIFLLTSLGMGLLISTTCRTQVQAIQLTVGIFLPSLLLTGFVFPLEPMPIVIKAISYSLPLTYYLDIIRGVIIKGTGFTELWFPALVLLLMASLTMGISILRFKKQVA